VEYGLNVKPFRYTVVPKSGTIVYENELIELVSELTSNDRKFMLCSTGVPRLVSRIDVAIGDLQILLRRALRCGCRLVVIVAIWTTYESSPSAT